MEKIQGTNLDFDIAGYSFTVPREAVAQIPLDQRDAARLMVISRRSRVIGNEYFRNIPRFFRPGDVLVLNRSRVFPARLRGQIANRETECLLLPGKIQSWTEIPLRSWPALLFPPPVLLPAHIYFPAGRTADVTRNDNGEHYCLNFPTPLNREYLESYGEVPLPPYIKRKPEDRNKFSSLDRKWYQTVYAEEEGSVAGPTAGFHFTEDLIQTLISQEVKVVKVVLHLGWGSFRPLRTADIREHRMAAEYYVLEPEVAETILSAREAGQRIFACGTSAVRVLESCTDSSGRLSAGQGWTQLYIYPGYRFRMVDALITNIHYPRSTPLVLTSAFAGLSLIQQAYSEALRLGYRFFSYGDAMLILE